MRTGTILLFLLIFLQTAYGQGNVTYGFKAGLNFSHFEGDPETDDNGVALEEFSSITGFHIGANVNIRFTDYIGMRTELLFTQKGGNILYDGPWTRFYSADSGNKVLFTGTAKENLSVFNNYAELPVMFYFKPGKRFELSAGVSAGLLLSSTATGSLDFQGTTANGTTANFNYLLDYNYLKDESGVATFVEPVIRISDGNETVAIPTTAGAYLQTNNDKGHYYKALDLGLNAGVSVYFNTALYLGLRLNYGLNDVTNDDFEFLRHKTDGANYIPNPGKVTNFNWQVSIGFNF